MDSTTTLSYAISKLSKTQLLKDDFFTQHQNIHTLKIPNKYIFCQIITYLRNHHSQILHSIDFVPTKHTYMVTFVQPGKSLTIYSHQYGEINLPAHPEDPEHSETSIFNRVSRFRRSQSHPYKVLDLEDIAQCSYPLYKLMITGFPEHEASHLILSIRKVNPPVLDMLRMFKSFTVTDFAWILQYLPDDLIPDVVADHPTIFDPELIFGPEVVPLLMEDLPLGEKEPHANARLLSLYLQLCYSFTLFYKAMMSAASEEESQNVDFDTLISYIEECLPDTLCENEIPLSKKVKQFSFQLSDLFTATEDGSLSTTRFASLLFSIPQNVYPTRSVIHKIALATTIVTLYQMVYLPTQFQNALVLDD